MKIKNYLALLIIRRLSEFMAEEKCAGVYDNVSSGNKRTESNYPHLILITNIITECNYSELNYERAMNMQGEQGRGQHVKEWFNW